MTRRKKKHAPKRLKPKPTDTGSDACTRNTEDIFQEAEKFRQAADTLLRIQLVRGF